MLQSARNMAFPQLFLNFYTKISNTNDRKEGDGREEHFNQSSNLLAEIVKHNDEIILILKPPTLYFRFQDVKSYREHIPSSDVEEASKAIHTSLKHPQTALPETPLMSYRWRRIKPLAKGMILTGVICIS